MKLPVVERPDLLSGLYVFDFGEWTAVGYTADEIAILLESERYRNGAIYRICRANPDGSMELRGVARERFQRESGTFFYRGEASPARQDFDTLRAAGERDRPPCRAFVHLADRGEQAGRARFVTALVYPEEYEDDIGRWLHQIRFAGGDWVEAGSSHVSNFYAEQKTLLARQQLWSATSLSSRSTEEVLANVRRAVQR